ncbi:sensor histidine kinase [Paenibacillus sp. DMB20]|uniref:sensor histidine kinase n=1 Tax=Paenibacillus sp. DMB20 TaxID=1642570 RepID=UPI002E12D2DD
MYHPQQQLIHAGLKYENLETALNYSFGSYTDHSTGEERYITVRSVRPIRWKIVGVAYPDEIVTTKRDLGEFLIWFLAVVLAFVVVISVFVSAKISKPIRRLEKSVKKVERGDFSSSVDVQGFVEVERVSHRFNLMVQRIRELMQQIIREQEAKRKSELDVLQAQINPHFLYNTLNSVIRLAESGRNEEVVKTITSLSKLFRISLSKGSHIITVREELEHVRNYLIIQNIRYKNKFRFTIDAEEQVLDCLTLKLILQPLVENAIVHGLEELYGPGMIRIEARRVEGNVQIMITDNGLGMSPEKLVSVLNGCPDSKRGSGVGVQNVQERIRLAYGQAYGLAFESEREEGTTVTVTLPVQLDTGPAERRLSS